MRIHNMPYSIVMSRVCSVLVRSRLSFSATTMRIAVSGFRVCMYMCVSRQDPITSSTTMVVSARLVGTRHSAAVSILYRGVKKKITSFPFPFPPRVIIILSPENK